MGKGRKPLKIILVAALLSWLLTWVAPVMAAGPTLAANVNEPFEVNGKLFPAGKLQVKSLGDLSPTQKINEIWVDDTCLGYLLARRGSAESQQAPSDAMFFARNQEGHLVLTGYTVANSGTNELFRYLRQTDETAFTSASLR